MEQTIVLIKPDGVKRGIVGEIIHRFERMGLKIVAMKMVVPKKTLLDKHYAQHNGKHFLPRLKKFMKSLPVVLVVLEGLDVVRVVRNMCGPTDGKNAPPGTIRGDYGMSTSANIIHSSEDLKAAKREIGIFFKKNELLIFKHVKDSMQPQQML